MSQIKISVDLRQLFGPARNQGARPTCMAFAASDAHAGIRSGWTDLSCEYVFYQAQRRAGRPPNVGALLSVMLETLRLDGQPAEAGWPYLSATPDISTWSPPNPIGDVFRRNSARTHHAVGEVIQQLDNGQPVIVLLQLSRSFFRAGADGVVDLALGELPDPVRRHAVVAVGHGTVDDQPAVLIRNSWGSNWGNAGYAWLTERYLAPRIYAAATLLEDINVSSNPVAA